MSHCSCVQGPELWQRIMLVEQWLRARKNMFVVVKRPLLVAPCRHPPVTDVLCRQNFRSSKLNFLSVHYSLFLVVTDDLAR